jgi:cytochrome P450
MRMTAPDPQAPVSLDELDLFDPARYSAGSQHPAWDRLRADAPMFRQTTPTGTPFWSVTRYTDVVTVLANTDNYGSEHGTILAVTGGDIAGGSTINLMDPPRHTYVRVPTIRTMSTYVMKLTSGAIRKNVLDLIAPLRDGGTVDIADLLLELPMTAIGQILGLAPETWRDVSLAAMRGVAPEDPAYAVGDIRQTLQDAHTHLFDVFSEAIRHHRRHPSEDLIGALLNLDYGGRPLTEEEVLLNCYSFAMGASTTTPHVAAHFVLAMAERPDTWAKLAADPSAIPTAVEEALRWATPTNHLLRRVNRPVKLRGTTLEEGDLVCAWVASANRDSRRFEDPYTFDPRRQPNKHLAFGFGRHYCIGAPAARFAIQILFEELAAMAGGFDLTGEPAHVHSNFINGISHLPVAIHAARP